MVAQAVEEQVEQSAGLVTLFGCPGDEGHSAEAGHDVAAYALDPEAAARLWQVSIDTLAG